MGLAVEDVFKVSGVPTHTFVYPSDYAKLQVALRSPGRGVIVEGPSGIGKSTAIDRALGELELADGALRLSARIPGDVDYIQTLPELQPFGVVIVDDFHRLSAPIRSALADVLKVLADTEDAGSKLVVIGINQAGESLINFAPDLAHRIDIIKLEVEPPEKIREVLTRGEAALNIELEASSQVVEASHGSFYIAQLLCRELCILANLTEGRDERVEVTTSFSRAASSVIDRQDLRFGAAVRQFARGNKFRPGGRAPYLHLLRWLAGADNWSVSVKDEIAQHPNERASVNVVVENGYLADLSSNQQIAEIIHYDSDTRTLSVEDPHLIFYLRNLDWPAFIQKCGFTKVDFPHEYDIALSFAGEDRAFAEALNDRLADLGLVVFYDLDKQHELLAQNVEDFLGPIYAVNSRFVVAILGEKYGEKRWTIFESDKYKHRIDLGEVIPIWSTAAPVGAFDKTRDIGGMRFDPNGDLDRQARDIAEVVAKKLDG